MSRLPFVRIGVIGLGWDWQEGLLPAILNMQSRVRVAAVYDDLADAARRQQQPLHADLILGIRPLLARKDIDALIVGRVGWQADWLWDRLREQSRPLWLGQNVTLNERHSDALQHSLVDEGTIVFPEFPLRFRPTTLRLHELMATTLGPIERMAIDAHQWALPTGDPLPLPHLLDWCASLIQRRAVAVEPLPGEPCGDAECGVRLVFDHTRASQQSLTADILWTGAAASGPDAAARDASPLCELTCETGKAVIINRAELQWTSGERWDQERLTSDRTAWEVMLDLFARRVSGGLIPTPNLEDLRRAHQLARAVQQVRGTGAAVPLH